jgi:hypothetical protein
MQSDETTFDWLEDAQTMRKGSVSDMGSYDDDDEERMKITSTRKRTTKKK